MSLTLRSGPPVRRAAAFASGLVVLAAAGCSEILGHDGSSVGDVLWRQAVVTVPHHWFGLPATDGDRVFFDVGNSVKAFDLESGHEQWSTPIRERLTAESQGIVHHGSLIVVVAEQRDIIAMDARTGQIRWRTRVDTSLNQTLGALDDRAFYTGTRSATVYAVDRENGSTLWSTWLGATWVNGNVLGHAVSGDTVFAGGWFRTVTTNLPYRAFVVALSRRNGKEIWRYESPPAPTSRAFETPLVLADGVVLAADDFGSAIVALDRRHGKPRWFARTDSTYTGPSHAPTVRGNTVYFGGGDGFVYAADLATGHIRWRSNTGVSLYHVAACGDFVFASMSHVDIFRRDAGTFLRTIMDQGEETISSDFLAVGRRIFASGSDAVYAFRC